MPSLVSAAISLGKSAPPTGSKATRAPWPLVMRITSATMSCSWVAMTCTAPASCSRVFFSEVRAVGRYEHHPNRCRFDERKRFRMLHDGMVGSENDLSVGEVLVQGECRDRTNGVAHGKIGDILAHGIDNTGAIISQARREYWGFDVSVVAPH